MPPDVSSNLGVLDYRLGVLERGLIDHRTAVEKRFAEWQLEIKQRELDRAERQKEISDKVNELVSWKDKWEGRIQAFGLIIIFLTGLNTILSIADKIKPP